MKLRLLRLLAAAPALVFLLPNSALAIKSGGVDVHGSVSVTASYSDTYYYLGDTREHFDLNLIDVVLNGTHRFDNGLRVGAQLYAYKIGDFNDITLDWANLDYSVKPWLGVRVGRNKVPIGLYNDSQDLDAVRTFASLPISFYPKTYRAISASIDGLSIYGNVSVGKAGSLDYQLFGGMKQDVQGDAPFVRGAGNMSIYSKWDFQSGVYGGSLLWNTPIDGLKLGVSYQDIGKCSMPGVLAPTSNIHGSMLNVPALVDGNMGAGTWDNSGLFAGTTSNLEGMRVQMKVLSAEYTRGKWLFAAEYKHNDVTDGTAVIPSFALLGMPTETAASNYIEEYYGMVTYQATDKLGLGLYYCYENNARKTAGSSNDPNSYTKDWAAAVSYALNDAWIFKVEGHLMNGRSQVFSAGDDNHSSGSDKNWTYLVVKSTFSF